jgi:hypothetical protein
MAHHLLKRKKQMRHCRYCRDAGHNKRTCPLRSLALRQAEKARMSARHCSYCFLVGHTRRKCDKLKNDMANDVKLNAEYRQKLADYMIANGIGIGAIVQRCKSGDNDIALYMIDNMRLDEITHREYNIQVVEAYNMSDPANGRRWFCLPIDAPKPREDAYFYEYSCCKIMSGTDEEAVRGMISAEWLSGKSGLDKHYQKRR